MAVNETSNGNLLGGPGNIQSAIRQFAARAGFTNGLNPSLVRNVWYVSGNSSSTLGVVGSDGNSGLSPLTPFLTMSRAFEFVKSFDVIVLMGVIREQLVCPVGVLDVTVYGAGNQPRQATNGGVYTGGGASWLAPASPTATTPLVRVIEQGWNFVNVQFAPVAASACITFDRRETAAIPDSSHGSAIGCYFSTGGAGGIGVQIIETKKTVVRGCFFEALTGAGGHAIKTTAGAGIANPSYCEIVGNKFAQNTNDCDLAGMDRGLITDNNFFTSNVILAGTRLKLSGGNGFNHVLNNNFSDIAADVTIAKGYTPGTSDVWRNWTTNTNVPIVVVPA